jgi:flagellar hook protein FlgE
MLGAIYIGLSGMDAYSKGLQIISNNVANLDTPGFKSQSVQFGDLFDGSGGGGLTYLGSSFSRQSGEGVQIGKSLLDFGQGNLQQTDNDLDLALSGAGFLTLLTKDGRVFYTRTGSFAVDKDGFISDQKTGYRLAVLDSTGKPVALNINDSRTFLPVASTTVTFDGLLGTTSDVSGVSVIDAKGTKHSLEFAFAKDTSSGAVDTWDVTVTDTLTNTAITDANGDPITVAFAGSAPSTQSATIALPQADGTTIPVTLDFSKISSVSPQGTLTATADGNAEGDLTTVTVDDTGQILLTYSNSQTAQKGAVAIADFRDPEDLDQLSKGLFAYKGTGELRYLASNTDGIGTLESKQIEQSNVDLSAEFGDLILVQRGFQACSQVVSVANDMIQQLFGIRGQG